MNHQVAMGAGGGGDFCCELCKGEAAVCCPSDSAFLCWSCDAKVHQANFLVARHLRFTVCGGCKSVTGNRVSGVREGPFSDLCRSCSPSPVDEEGEDLDALSSSSTCVSSAHSSCSRKSGRSSEWSDSAGGFSAAAAEKKSQKRPPPPRGARSEAFDPVAEGIFVNWCARLGIGGGEDKHVTRKARGAFRLCLAHMTALPYRVSLAASLWFGLRRCPGKPGHTWRALRRLEQISGVPAKLIASAESKLHVVEKAGKQRRQWLTEGWGECSV
ncbi:PREDICTED: B-box zinc finger protein 32-like [Ipomoea nil]|uniref:B-box zinc finger protein 32-like n=1 Tax=Ipomoea nil TaxID=35883 RepID=UPI000901DEAA|nr:PREDICTED: B-box zinc finger protein 32-like [Ipomoea nil]